MSKARHIIKKALLLVVVLSLLTASFGCGNSGQLSDTLTAIDGIVSDGQTVTGKIQALVDWKADSWEAEKEREKLYKETGKEKYEPEDASAETAEKSRELSDIITEIDGLKVRADALAAGADENENTAVYAARAYIKMLSSAAVDLKSVFKYYEDLMAAIKIMDEFKTVESTTGTTDYSLIAGQMSYVVNSAQAAVGKIEAPSFMAGSNNHLKTQLDDLQGFCQSLSIAVQYNDPLRLNSAMYRSQRITKLMNAASSGLSEDINSQFIRTGKRLENDCGTLNRELGDYLSVRKAGNAGAKPSFTYLAKEPTPVIDYTTVKTISPGLYRSIDYIVELNAVCENDYDNNNSEILVEVEIPGFTQKYSQKLTLTSQMTKIDIKPPLITADLNLDTEKTAQITVSAKRLSDSKILLQDSVSIVIKSKFDVTWWSKDYEDSYYDNILAWLTPESDGVAQVRRAACDYLSDNSDGAYSSLLGYQSYGFEDVSSNTWLQLVAIQGAISDGIKVRYNNGSFSINSETDQRVLLPDDVVRQRSGICIETSLLFASCIQSAGMHAMIIFPPGHAQVAVEAWPNTGEYFLVETTVLPMEASEEGWDKVITYMTKDEWLGYLDGTGEKSLGECYVLDCDLSKTLGILPLSN